MVFMGFCLVAYFNIHMRSEHVVWPTLTHHASHFTKLRSEFVCTITLLPPRWNYDFVTYIVTPPSTKRYTIIYLNASMSKGGFIGNLTVNWLTIAHQGYQNPLPQGECKTLTWVRYFASERIFAETTSQVSNNRDFRRKISFGEGIQSQNTFLTLPRRGSASFGISKKR